MQSTTDSIDRPEAETILRYLTASDATMRVAQLRVLGGAMARVPVEATAFAHRGSRIMVNIAAVCEGPEDSAPRHAWVGDFMDALRQGEMARTSTSWPMRARRGCAPPIRGLRGIG